MLQRSESLSSCNLLVLSAHHRRNNRRDRGTLVGFRLGTNNVLVPLNFLAVVFKKQEISQQVVTRMQALASGDTPGPSQREGATPSPAFGRLRGTSAPVFGPKPWSPSIFQPWLRPWCTHVCTVPYQHPVQLR